jgi:hypothetical protein
MIVDRTVNSGWRTVFFFAICVVIAVRIFVDVIFLLVNLVYTVVLLSLTTNPFVSILITVDP